MSLVAEGSHFNLEGIMCGHWIGANLSVKYSGLQVKTHRLRLGIFLVSRLTHEKYASQVLL